MAAIDMDKMQFDQMVGSGRPVLVDFWAPWCGYCRRIGPAYEKIAETYGNEITVAKVDVDKETALAELERIEVLPTLVFYRDGKAVDSIVAPTSKAMIEGFIQRVLADREDT